MDGNLDIGQKEKIIASQAENKLRNAIRIAVSNTTESKTGNALRTSGASSRFKLGRLQRLIIKAPDYVFMQNYGFEGSKSNGVNMRLNATDVLSKALESSNILEHLADEISELRLDQVTALIQFKK